MRHQVDKYSCSLPQPVISSMESAWSLQSMVCHIFLSNKDKQIDQAKAVLLYNLEYPSHAGYTVLTPTVGKVNEGGSVCFLAVSVDEDKHCPSHQREPV